VKSGSFVYDVELSNLPEWIPTENELRILSANMVKFAQKSYKFDRLAVSEELALDIFQENKFKKEQVPNIAQQSIGKDIIIYSYLKFYSLNLFVIFLFSLSMYYVTHK